MTDAVLQTVRAVLRLILFCIWTLLLVPVQFVLARWLTARGIRHGRQSPIVMLWYRGVLALLNLRVQIEGMLPNRDKRMLYVANHCSYLDIMVLGAALPAFFVAKADTADWPIFGGLIRIGGTLFISRQRAKVRQQMALFGGELRAGRELLVFPEGTTSDGLSVLPFKSGLLNVLAEPDLRDIEIVPVCINYVSVNGTAFGPVNHDLVAWYANMTLLPHLWRVFQQKSLAACVTILPPVHLDWYATASFDAKQLAARCEDDIRNCFTANRPVSDRPAG